MKSEHHLDDDALSSIAVCEFVDFPRGTGTTVGASHLKRDCSGHGASQFMTQQQLKSRTVNDQSDKMKNDDWSIQRTAPSAVFLLCRCIALQYFNFLHTGRTEVAICRTVAPCIYQLF